MSRLFSLGARTCLKLKQLEEAINWCDKGLAVSFLYPVHRPSFFSIEIFMCTKENKNWKGFIKPQRTGEKNVCGQLRLFVEE